MTQKSTLLYLISLQTISPITYIMLMAPSLAVCTSSLFATHLALHDHLSLHSAQLAVCDRTDIFIPTFWHMFFSQYLLQLNSN